jgi:hypothetical protein
MTEIQGRVEDAPSTLEADVIEFLESLSERELVGLSSPAEG